MLDMLKAMGNSIIYVLKLMASIMVGDIPDDIDFIMVNEGISLLIVIGTIEYILMHPWWFIN